MRDAPVPQLDEMVDGLLEPGRVVGPHDVDGPVAHGASDDHHRQPGRQPGQVRRRGLRAEQYQRLAAVLHQARDRPFLVAAGCDGAQREFVADAVRRGVEPVHQVAVERVLHPEHHAEQPAAAAAQEPGAEVGAVAQLVRHRPYPLPGRRARAGCLPHDDRDQRGGHARPHGDVGERRAAIHAVDRTRTFY